MSSITNYLDSATALSLAAAGRRTATVTGSAVDLQIYEGKAKVVLDATVVSGTSPTLDGKLQESADGSTGWADITGKTWAQLTTGSVFTAIDINTSEVKRYVRFVGTITGTSPVIDLSVQLTAQKKSF